MSLHGGGAFEAGARAGAAADRLVILVRVVAEGEVVHRALGRGELAGGGEERVGDELAGFDIACDDGGRGSWSEHRALRNDELHRLEAAFVHGDIVIDEGAHDVKCGRAGDRGRRVEVVGLLRARAFEADAGATLASIDADVDRDPRAVVGFHCERAALEPADHLAYGFCGVVPNVMHVGEDDVAAVFDDDSMELVCTPGARGNLRFDVAEVLRDVSRGPRAL